MTDTAATAVPQPEAGIEPDDLDTKMIVAIGLISTALLIASVLGVTALVDQFESLEVNEKVYQAAGSGDLEADGSKVLDADKLVDLQQAQLDGTAPLEADGPTMMPIEEAKKLVLEELKANRQ